MFAAGPRYTLHIASWSQVMSIGPPPALTKLLQVLLVPAMYQSSSSLIVGLCVILSSGWMCDVNGLKSVTVTQLNVVSRFGGKPFCSV